MLLRSKQDQSKALTIIILSYISSENKIAVGVEMTSTGLFLNFEGIPGNLWNS